jgi:multisubunit Na+/H+ antiporter MnhB subunit
MNSLILTTVTRLVFFVVLLFSVYLLLRGHNSPGGGFIAGVMTALGILLQAIASDLPSGLPWWRTCLAPSWWCCRRPWG